MPHTKMQMDVFEVARTKARNTDELRLIDELFRLVGEIEPAKNEATERIRANKIARGEKVPKLTQSMKEFLADLEPDDLGMGPQNRKHYESMETAGEVLKLEAYSQIYAASLSRSYLYAHHEDDKAVEMAVIERQESLGGRLLAFIGDAAYSKKVYRDVARDAIGRGTGGGSDIYAILNIENPLDLTTDGKSVGKAFDKLDQMAATLKVAPLGEYFGFGGRESEDWFDPSSGLATIEALVRHVRLSETKLKGKKALIEDLEDIAAVLKYAKEHNARFHIEIDI